MKEIIVHLTWDEGAISHIEGLPEQQNLIMQGETTPSTQPYTEPNQHLETANGGEMLAVVGGLGAVALFLAVASRLSHSSERTTLPNRR